MYNKSSPKESVSAVKEKNTKTAPSEPAIPPGKNNSAIMRKNPKINRPISISLTSLCANCTSHYFK